ncbi:MAG: aspartate-semialdehyde dehydrogenase [Candidatus Izimaplasma sp.]|nr:aspartate-semialdehyde dehydrogenase [Candidatus Izimaplasma bacterium]
MNLAIVGATGLVGQTFIKIIEERNIPFNHLFLYASKRSAGKEITVNNTGYKIIECKQDTIVDKKIDYVLFSAGKTISNKFAKYFVKIGAIVIDNSSAFRFDDTIPLVVPEVNPNDIKLLDKIISNPNCSSIQGVLPLYTINKLSELVRVDYTTYQAVSGSGQKGIEDLQLTQSNKPPKNYKYPIYNNVLPQIDTFSDGDFTFEEIKMVKETKKILHQDYLEVSATCVRVPVLNSHSVSIIVETKDEINIDSLKDLFKQQKGITLFDNPDNEVYPMPAITTGKDDVYVGRIRKDLFNKKKIHLFVCADNIRKGAALNAIQILEVCMKGEN